MFKFSLLGLLFGALIFTATIGASPAQAQEGEPPWQHNLECKDEDQHYLGVEYCTQEFLGSLFHVIVLDLSSPGLRLEYLIVEGRDRFGNTGECQDVNIPSWSDGPGCHDPDDASLYPVMTLERAVERGNEINAAVVINADYSACTVLSQSCPLGRYRSHGPEGLTVLRGNRLDGPEIGDTDDNAVKRPWLALNGETPLQVEIHQPNEDDGSKPFNWIYTGVGGGPWLIKDREVQDDDIENCTNLEQHSCSSYVAQTAVGISEDNSWLYLVAAKGQNAKGMAEFMHQQLDLQEAIKFDGGGSTQLWYGGTEEPYVLTGDGRSLTNYLAIIAQEGAGIDTPVEPEPGVDEEPVDPSSFLARWWQGLVQGVEDLLQEQQEKLTEWWDQQLENVQQQIEAWLEAQTQRLLDQFALQMEQWLLQCCGSMMLPTGFVVLLQLKRRKQSR
jgi:hypothetical protein